MLVCTSMPKIHFCLNFLKLRSLVENGRPPDPADWAVTDVVNYFRTVGFEEQANAFQEQVNLFAQSFLLLISSLGDFRVGTITGIFLALQRSRFKSPLNNIGSPWTSCAKTNVHHRFVMRAK